MTEIFSPFDAASGLAPAPDPSREANALGARFQPIFDRIAARALAREHQHGLAYEAVGWLRDAGFTALRVPVEMGGGGVSQAALFGLVTTLAAAGSNLPQVLGAHFGVVEYLLALADRRHAERWLTLVGEGAILGTAMAERGGATDVTVWLSPDARTGGWRLDGHIHHSTGSRYADWIAVVGSDGEDRVLIAIEADASGVTRMHRLAGSGTTRFDDVAVPANRVISRGRFAQLQALGHNADCSRTLLTQAAE